MTCTFFGHRDTPKSIEPILHNVLTDLIENKKADMFYLGNNGNFDSIVKNNLKILKRKYPHINYNVVLAYLPSCKSKGDTEDYSDTIYHEALEKTPYKFAIVKRNMWMTDRSDFVVVYVKNPVGCARKFKDAAEKKNKIVLNLADME